ncbi:hypothetical protein CSAL01_08471 [Colletotrichum salicis]|uniref:Uncharacterized protein n=1 Tax=Colletotrichum salicis TaxID=1209931 RepID=A0A135UHI5_9PEZI|nr:hypothetical protein CSAL01_08471 [Colletotrichum salicis]
MFPSSPLPVSAKQRPLCSSAQISSVLEKVQAIEEFAQGRQDHQPTTHEPESNPRKTQFFCHCLGFHSGAAHIVLRLNDGNERAIIT